MPKLLQNALRIEENGKITYLNSFYRHDFVAHTFADSKTIFLDGGCSFGEGGYYIRIGGSALDDKTKNWRKWFITTKDNFQKRANRLLWGHYELPGCKGGFKYSLVKDLSLSHLQNIIKDIEAEKYKITELHEKVIRYWIEKKNKCDNI